MALIESVSGETALAITNAVCNTLQIVALAYIAAMVGTRRNGAS